MWPSFSLLWCFAVKLFFLQSVNNSRCAVFSCMHISTLGQLQDPEELQRWKWKLFWNTNLRSEVPLSSEAQFTPGIGRKQPGPFPSALPWALTLGYSDFPWAPCQGGSKAGVWIWSFPSPVTVPTQHLPSSKRLQPRRLCSFLINS